MSEWQLTFKGSPVGHLVEMQHKWDGGTEYTELRFRVQQDEHRLQPPEIKPEGIHEIIRSMKDELEQCQSVVDRRRWFEKFIICTQHEQTISQNILTSMKSDEAKKFQTRMEMKSRSELGQQIQLIMSEPIPSRAANEYVQAKRFSTLMVNLKAAESARHIPIIQPAPVGIKEEKPKSLLDRIGEL